MFGLGYNIKLEELQVGNPNGYVQQLAVVSTRKIFVKISLLNVLKSIYFLFENTVLV